jgi:large subunit ribosomal protein L22
MFARAVSKNQRISPMKVREVTRVIQGMPVSQALDLVNYTPKKAAYLVGKTLKSAIANAETNHSLDVGSLVVLEATGTEGQALSRFTPRARGSASTIKRRCTHISILLWDSSKATPEEDAATESAE